MSQQVAYYPLVGGEDLVTPPLQVDPGRILFSENYEPGEAGGYRRIDGYERFDGRVKPSEASFVTIPFDAGSNEPAVNDALSASISGFTGYVAGYSVTSGDWATNDAVGTLAVHDATGTFVDNDVFTNTTQANTLATQNGAQEGQAAPTDALYNTWLQASIEWRRSQITTVPGSGDILGVWQYNGTKYAFRNNGGATAAVMYESTSSGWSTVDLGVSLAFTAGSTSGPFTIGETITGSAGTGAKTAVVSGYTVTSGAWSTNDAAGTVYLNSLSGTITAGNITGGTSGVTANNAGTTATVTLPAGGKYEFWNYNFIGRASGQTMYFTNGVGLAMSYNGDGLSFIDFGLGTVYPTHIRPHKKHLFLTFGASLIHSDIGNPYEASAVGGAAEFAVGDTITGIDVAPGDVLAVMSRSSTHLLYGTSAADWDLREHSLVSGAREWTIQRISTIRYLDDRGLTQLNAVYAFGDFKENTFSQRIDPLVESKLGTEIESVTVREKDQYRIFFSDGSALICRIKDGGQLPQFTRMLYPVPVLACTGGENSSGLEEIFFGSNDGYVYQMDKGTSFDGDPIEYVLRLPFNNLKSPRSKKRFFKAILEIEAPGGTTLQFTPDFSYGDSSIPKAVQQSLDIESGAAYWNEGSLWGDFMWGTGVSGDAEAYIDGSGLNMAFLIRGSSTYDESHTITSVLLHYTVRGLKR